MNIQNPDRSYGRLSVRAFSAGSSFPVEGALVFVRGRRADGEAYTVAVLETDESGKTPVITLETPPRSVSLTPGGGTPYAIYDLEISHRDYYTVITRGVQVYPDTVSVLPVNMLPLPDSAGSEKYPSDNIIINNGDSAPNL